MSAVYDPFGEPEPFRLRPYARAIPTYDLPRRPPATVRLTIVHDDWTQPLDVITPTEPTIHAARPTRPVLDAACWVLGLVVAPLRWVAHRCARAARWAVGG